MGEKAVTMHRDGSLCTITFPKLERCGAVRHTFSTRLGGISTGDCASMNLSFHKDSCFENVLENFRRLCEPVGISTENLVLSAQTHTDHVEIVTEKDRGRGMTKPAFSDVDGLITASVNVALVTQYADCTPLLFCDPIRRVVATSHSGWRGTAAQIGRKTVEKMVAVFGCKPEDIIAAIGPCIGPCCYEVDDPVFEAFRDSGLNLNRIFIPKGDGKHYRLDLSEANRQILLNCGIRPENLDIADLCTCCHHDLLHSHRATGGKRGTLAAVIQLK